MNLSLGEGEPFSREGTPNAGLVRRHSDDDAADSCLAARDRKTRTSVCENMFSKNAAGLNVLSSDFGICDSPIDRQLGCDMRERSMSSDATKLSRQDQAANWFAAERAGVMLVEQRAEFEAWKADPRNMAALDAMRELWDDLAVLKGRDPTPAKRPMSRFLPVAAAMVVLAIGGIAAATVLLSPADTPIVTAEGQQKTQSMPDGSVIAVNVASAVSYNFTDTERRVTLSDGEAAFFVKPDPDKPFVVRVGDLEVRAVGTSFNVRQRDGVLQVSVSEGQVQLCRVTGAGESVIANLSAGQLLQIPASMPAAAVTPAPASIPPSQVSEWRMRVVTYEDATVREVIEDFNRYFERKLVVSRPELLDRRVTVRLQVENREGAIETLAALLDAKVSRSEREDALTY